MEKVVPGVDIDVNCDIESRDLLPSFLLPPSWNQISLLSQPETAAWDSQRIKMYCRPILSQVNQTQQLICTSRDFRWDSSLCVVVVETDYFLWSVDVSLRKLWKKEHNSCLVFLLLHGKWKLMLPWSLERQDLCDDQVDEVSDRQWRLIVHCLILSLLEPLFVQS